jgi:hypothetical protein
LTTSGSDVTSTPWVVGTHPTPHSARRVADRFDGENCERSTPRGQRLTFLKLFECNIAFVDGEGQSVIKVLIGQYLALVYYHKGSSL